MDSSVVFRPTGLAVRANFRGDFGPLILEAAFFTGWLSGSFVLTGSGFEGSECEGWFGLDLFPDHREGLAWEAAIEDSQEPVADQG